MTVALTIAGSDSCGGAGIQLDLRVFDACGVPGASVVTALTAQSPGGVHRRFAVPPRSVAAQIDALVGMPIAAAKTGMLDRAQVVSVVAGRIARRRIPLLVVDPVITATDGTPLLSDRGVERLRRELLPLAVLVTPNAPEAARLAGLSVEDDESAREAARRIAALGPRGVVITGGHRDSPEGETADLLYWEGDFYEFRGERLPGPPVHGTGCAYSAAVTARLALGDTVPEACRFAREFTAKMIRTSWSTGKGARLAAPFGPAPEAEE